MKIRHENGEVLVDFNERGWNPEVLLSDISEEQFEKFEEGLAYYCDTTGVGIGDLDLQDCVNVVVTLANEGVL